MHMLLISHHFIVELRLQGKLLRVNPQINIFLKFFYNTKQSIYKNRESDFKEVLVDH